METTTLTATPRTAIGTRCSRELRKTGFIPAIIYGHGGEPEAVSLCLRDVTNALELGARTLHVAIEDKTQQFLIKAVQYDHLSRTPIHLDLARVSLDERVTVKIGIEPRGTPKGLSDGGILDIHMASIELECVVTEIPATLHPLVSELGVGDSLYVKDLELPASARALSDPDDRIATVHLLGAPADAAEPEEESEDAAQPERIGRVKKEDEEEKKKS